MMNIKIFNRNKKHQKRNPKFHLNNKFVSLKYLKINSKSNFRNDFLFYFVYKKFNKFNINKWLS